MLCGSDGILCEPKMDHPLHLPLLHLHLCNSLSPPNPNLPSTHLRPSTHHSQDKSSSPSPLLLPWRLQNPPGSSPLPFRLLRLALLHFPWLSLPIFAGGRYAFRKRSGDSVQRRVAVGVRCLLRSQHHSVPPPVDWRGKAWFCCLYRYLTCLVWENKVSRKFSLCENINWYSVLLLGDNIFGTSAADAAESLFKAFSPVMESRLPWAAVLGNHDQKSTMTREELMTFISLMDYSLSQINPPEDPSDPAIGRLLGDIDGFGNYNLSVNGAAGSLLANSSVLNLFFLDSGDRATVGELQTYGWIKESQLRWLRGLSQGFLSPPTETPALAFFHIPVPEVRQLYLKEIVGQFQQPVSCSMVNSGVLQSLVSMGDVKAVFVGHDHTNDFCGNLDGIWFCYGGGCGYHGYGRAGWPRRARIIVAELGKGEMAWMGVERIRTWKRLDDEKLSKIDEQVLWDLHRPQ